MQEFLQQYGYIALSVGTFFEGETAILVASCLAATGLFKLPFTVFFGFLGSFVSDWLYFTLGRLNGKLFLERRPKLLARIQPVRSFFDTHRLQILFSYRFLYGFRIIIPVMLGMSDIRAIKFLGYSILAGLLWASVVSVSGFVAGTVLELEVRSFENNILPIALGFACFGLTLGFFTKRYAERRIKQQRTA